MFGSQLLDPHGLADGEEIARDVADEGVENPIAGDGDIVTGVEGLPPVLFPEIGADRGAGAEEQESRGRTDRAAREPGAIGDGRTMGTPGCPDGYEILRRIDRGGTGEVWKARETATGEVVAVKIFDEGWGRDPQRSGRFGREAALIAELDHPNIVKVRGHGIHKRRPFIVMEFVQGVALDRILLRGPLPERTALSLCRRIAEAIEFLHSRNIIHRDLKPSNIMVRKGGRVVLLDFGFMKSFAEDEVLREAGKTLGTPAYMAPEMVEGDLHRTDERTDVFSLGAILYEMLAGVRAFPASETEGVLRQVLRMRPTPVREIRPEVSRDSEQVCHKSLAKDPADRYPTAKQMANALGRILLTGHL